MGRKAIAKATREARPETAMFEAPLLFPLEGLAANPCGAKPGDIDPPFPVGLSAGAPVMTEQRLTGGVETLQTVGRFRALFMSMLNP